MAVMPPFPVPMHRWRLFFESAAKPPLINPRKRIYPHQVAVVQGMVYEPSFESFHRHLLPDQVPPGLCCFFCPAWGFHATKI